MTKTRRPAPPPQGLRQRARADGTMRVWWEPRADARKHGFAPVDLSDLDPTQARARARKLNDEVRAAEDGKGAPPAPRANGRTISDLIREYRRSIHFRNTLSEKTRKSYNALLNQIEEKWGTRRVVDFDKPVMNAWYQTLFDAKGVRMAQALIRMMSVLFSYAESELGWRPENSNPCFRLKIKSPDPRSRVGAWEEVDALLAAAEGFGYHAMALAIRLALFQGQRETDLILAVRGAFMLLPMLPPGGTRAKPVWIWKFRRSKRSNDGFMPLHADVIPHVRAALTNAGTADKPRLPTDALLIDEAVGRPYDEDLFAKRWSKIRARAAEAEGMRAIATLQFRDLRRTFGVFARAGGASTDDTGDVLGNSAANNPLLEEIYMPPSFATTSRAIAAVKRPQKKGQKT
ncbi:MAG: hypothetical protein DI533_04545 [Cereibacter sphaeroides]|uniref:Core-binding (CB) domain-containing protein n=1 Tax=Cereibacter sphaeroides TaxID=1063 RepID=A0A2W5SKR4_CERSP|nr:MAG: hypothetical protein DI533_04545 [Cereibacter sphaeroides]